VNLTYRLGKILLKHVYAIYADSRSCVCTQYPHGILVKKTMEKSAPF
jgi:hypothetical protein